MVQIFAACGWLPKGFLPGINENGEDVEREKKLGEDDEREKELWQQSPPSRQIIDEAGRDGQH